MTTQIESLREHVQIHLQNGTIKDESGLNDFQKTPDHHGIPIPKVGITRFRIPLRFHDGLNHDCQASMYVNLPAGKTGINMSRLCSILQETGAQAPVNKDFFFEVLKRFRHELKDDQNEKPLHTAFLALNFDFPVKQTSLKSGNWGWQYYACRLEGKMVKKKWKLKIQLDYEYSSTCPCSLSMAKQYERDFAEGKTQEGNGIGTAHSQRSLARTQVDIDIDSNFWIEDLILLLRAAIPTETQSLVKRVDEQAFAILNGSNPMFVEHASKRIYKLFNQDPRILDWMVEMQHFESLHSHNAAAVIFKGIEGGFAHDGLF